MIKQLLINLPVTDIEKSKQFFEAIGLELNRDLSDDQATCFNLQASVVVVLLPTSNFKEAINGRVVADGANEMLLSLGAESKEAVDEMTSKAVEAGATETQEPVDLPQIYGRAFADPDGHLWNIFYAAA